MAAITIEIQTLLPGSPQTPMKNGLELHLVEERLTAAVLIQLTVEERMQKLKAHQLQTLWSANNGASALFTPPSEGNTTTEENRALFPSRSLLQVEIEKALHAFESGYYLLLINRHRVRSLDEEITFSPGTQVQFLRLTPLRGG